jgi:hypothetical protein
MHMSVSQNTDMVAGLEAVIVTENGRGGACHTTCLVILRLRETLTTSSSLLQALCNLLGIIADAAHAWILVRLSTARMMIGAQKVRLLRWTAEIPVHDALDPVPEISTTLMLGTQRATSPHPHNAILTTTSNKKNLLLAVAALQRMKNRQMYRHCPVHLVSGHRSYHQLLHYSHRT